MGLVLLCCIHRSGSTLLLRLLNESGNSIHICGENYNALGDLLQFYHKCQRVTQGPFKTPGDGSFYSYDQLIKMRVKPAFHNIYNLEEIKTRVSNLVQTMYNPEKKWDLWGFKEIRIGQNQSKKDFYEVLALYQELFPDIKIVFLVRDLKEYKKYRFSKKKMTNYRLQKKYFRNFYHLHKNWTYFLTYADILSQNATFKGLFQFLNLKYQREKLVSVFKVKMR